MGSYKPTAGHMEESEGDAKVSNLNSDIVQNENFLPLLIECQLLVLVLIFNPNSSSRVVKINWNKL